jgi:hypothetical protein
VVSPKPLPLYPQEKSPQYPLDRRLGGPQSRSGRGGEKTKKNTRRVRKKCIKKKEETGNKKVNKRNEYEM